MGIGSRKDSSIKYSVCSCNQIIQIKMRLIPICYIEILLKLLFRILFLYPDLYWEINNIHALVDSIKSCSGRFDSIRDQLTVYSYTFPSLK